MTRALVRRLRAQLFDPNPLDGMLMGGAEGGVVRVSAPRWYMWRRWFEGRRGEDLVGTVAITQGAKVSVVRVLRSGVRFPNVPLPSTETRDADDPHPGQTDEMFQVQRRRRPR